MKKVLLIGLIGLIALLLNSCIPNTPINTDYETNFEALWKIIDERYCFLDEKQVNWDQVHEEYAKRLRSQQYNDVTFFYLMDEMLNELKDGHVNLYSDFDIGSYHKLVPDPTTGLNVYARSRHIKGRLNISGGMRYGILADKDRDITIGYISYGSFSNSLGNMSLILTLFEETNGVIIDVRGNGGGLVDNANRLASYFYKDKKLVGYTVYKTGPGHSDFSNPRAQYISPNKQKTFTTHPVIVLQDRSSFSATNDFLYKIALADNVIRIGEISGGGTGMPATSELPNGWRVRYSAVKSYDKDMNQLEGGFAPDIEVHNDSYYEKPDAKDRILVAAVEKIFKLREKKQKNNGEESAKDGGGDR